MKELALQNCRIDGRYNISESLGRGSYAEIYLARDVVAANISPHAFVVIKALNVFLQDELDNDLERTLVENFQNEAVALDRVRHPNVVSRLGHGTARDLSGTVFHYIVLEYLSGGDLFQYCKGNPLSFTQTFDYLEQICAGLSHAHKCGVIHRDIKPQNLLLTKDKKTVKIADFGVARLMHSNTPITRVGTNIYAPPEHSPAFIDTQNFSRANEITPAADVYSLAKSAYVLMTGESPRKFANVPITDLPISISNEPWANSFLRVLNKATQHNPKDRQQTIQEFWQDLFQVKLHNETAEKEVLTEISSRQDLIPQASVSQDFSPKAPILPSFQTSENFKLPKNQNPNFVVRLQSGDLVKPPANQPQIIENEKFETQQEIVPIKKKSNFFKRAAIFAIFLFVFAGALFATHNFLRNRGILPEISNPFSKPQGVANTDVNIRPTAGVDQEPIGLVPKGSKVKILNTKDNWIEVEIVDLSRPKNNANDAEKGWVNRRYIDLD
ncbi:MAG: serine/threonine protein kinase [Pyrinomonadaceae bacterium]|nr:serine/threonine protein kinase [Pyrinomonadaceae bacterium]